MKANEGRDTTTYYVEGRRDPTDARGRDPGFSRAVKFSEPVNAREGLYHYSPACGTELVIIIYNI